jgi:hypothetical protein
MAYQHRLPPPVPTISMMTWDQSKRLLEDFLKRIQSSTEQDPTSSSSGSSGSDVFAFFVGA